MFQEILSKLGGAFEKNKVPYMVIGGQAVLLYGEPRLTRDIDITLGFDTDRLQEILNIMTTLGYRPLPSKEKVESFVRETMVLPLHDESTGIRIDLIFSFTPYEAQAIQRAQKVWINEQSVAFASVEDVIIHKIIAMRPRDLEDVSSMVLKNSNLDQGYIKLWLKEFDCAAQQELFVNAFQKISDAGKEP